MVLTLLLIPVSGCRYATPVHDDPPARQELESAAAVAATESRPHQEREYPEVEPTENALLQPGTTSPERSAFVETGVSPVPARVPENYTRPDPADGDIQLNFQETDLQDVVRVMLGEILQQNYSIDPGVTGSVTLHTARPLAQAELLPLLEQVLAMHGAILVEDNQHVRVLPESAAAPGGLFIPGRDTAGHGIRVIALEHVAASELRHVLTPFLHEGVEVQIDNQRNLLLLQGPAHRLNQLQELVDLFDVDWLRGKSVGLYPLDHASPEHLRTELHSILHALHGDETGQPLLGLIRIIPLQRLQSVLLVGDTPAALRQAEHWLHRLDQPGESEQRQLYVHRLNNARAVELARILGQVFGHGHIDPDESSTALAPGLDPVEILSARQQAMSPPELEITDKPDIQAQEDSAVDIIADDTRNALVILARPADYQRIQRAIEQLDTVPLQVLIEASILEVTLTDELSYGVEWFFRNNFGDATSQGLLDLGTPGIGPLSPAYSYTLLDSAGDVRLAINALAEETHLNVLSSPSLMVLDNRTAQFNVGDEIPVPSRQSISNLDPNAPIVNEIAFRRTGVTLDVTPRVNDSGLVTLEIQQEVSNAVTTTSSSIDAPTIQQRSIHSTVAVYHGETIVLGGLIRDSQYRDHRGLPVLHRIPLLGALFGSSGNETARTELLVLLTPRIVRDRNESRLITEEFRRQLENVR